MPGASTPGNIVHQGHLKALKQQPLGLFLQDPTGCLHPSPAAPQSRSHHPQVAVLEEPRPLPAPNLPVSPPSEHPDPTFAGRGLHATFRWMVLLRKEVIQPHLPVRLPCYDFVPIASPTFDGSLHKGWATGFGCCRLS